MLGRYKPNLQRLTNCLGLVHVLPSVELFCRAIGKASVQANVLLLLRKAVEGNPQLERLWYRGVEPLDGLEGDRGSDFAGCQLGEGEDIALAVLGLGGDPGPARDRALLPPSSPVVHHRLRLRDPRTKGVLGLENFKYLE